MIRLVLVVFALFFGFSAFTQTQIDTIRFNSGWQGMFNSSTDPNPYTVNEWFGLPPGGPIEWDEGFTWNAPSFSTGSINLGPFGSFAGFGFSASFYMNTQGYFGVGLEIYDFEGDSLLVNYPAKITTNYPPDLSFDYGDWIGIKTSYVVVDETDSPDSAYIDSRYPTGGAVDFNFGAYVGAHIGASLSVTPFGTLSYDFLSLDFGQPETNLFHVSDDTSYYFGEANPVALPSLPIGPGGSLVPQPDPAISAIPGYPDGYPSVAFPACGDLQALIPGACQIAQVWTPELPIEGSLGLVDGVFSLPYIDLDSTVVVAGKDLVAKGDSTYISISIDLFKMLSSIISSKCGTGVAENEPPGTPNPYCVAAEVILGNLSNSISQSIPGLSEDLEIWYNLLSARFELSVTNKQRFDFKPTVYGKYNFPTPVQFKVVNAAGVTYQNSTSNVINYTVGDSIYVKYPCFYEDFKIKRSFSIDGKITSYTYDSLDFSFVFDGMGFGLNIPGFTILPSYTWSFCIPYGYPCGSVFWPSWCTGEWCETISTPYIGFPSISWNTCSLGGPYAGSQPPPLGSCSITFIQESLGDLIIDWNKRTWSLEGFNPLYPADTLILRGRNMSAVTSTTDALCYGGTGSIFVDVSNGTLPFSVSWNNGAASSVNSYSFSSPNFPAGNYVASIIDANGCQIYAGDEIRQPDQPISIIDSIIDDRCNDAIGGGMIELIEVYGGTPGYTYGWTGPASYSSASQIIGSLQPGDYDLTITDANSCTYTKSYTINQPLAMSDTVVIIQHVKCNSDATGLINVEMTGGNLPYTYSWENLSNSSVVGNAAIVDNLTAGDYELTVLDSAGCTFVESYTINEPTALTLTTNITHVVCNGTNSGQIVALPGGGASGYSYSWFNAATQMLSSTINTISNQYAGDYTVVVRDQNNCEISLLSTINQPDPIAVSSSNVQNVDCYGNSSGSILIDVIGGVPGYTFDWNNDGSGDFDDSEDLTNIPSGNYELVIMDQNSCTKPFSYVVTQPDESLSAVPTLTHVKCFGDNTGSISVLVQGGTAPYTYDWNIDGIGDFDDLLDINSLVSGSYTLTVKDANDCIVSFTVDILQPNAPLSVTEVHTDVLCFGGDSGTIDLTTTGGTTPYVYSWSNGAAFVMTATTEDLSNLSTDNYSVIVTDNQNCQAALTIPIGQPAAPLSLASIITAVDCFGNNSGEIDLSVNGGTSPYTYDWSNDGTGDSDDTEDLNSLLSGSYNVTVTDFNACTAVGIFDVSQPSQGIQLSAMPQSVLCFGDSTGNIELTVNGGTSPYVFDWDNDGTGDFDDPQNLINIPSAVYTVNVEDANGCQQSIGGFVAQPLQALSVVPSSVEPSCFGYTDGSIDLTITGGTTPYYMQWGNNNEYLLNNPSEVLTGLGKGVYFFRVRDKNGCIVEQYVNVGQPDTLEVDNSIVDVNCYNGFDGSIDLSPNGGTPPYSYIWSNGGSTEDLSGLTSDYYEFLLTDANGCLYSEVLFVNQPPDINIAYQISPLSCIDQTDASIEVQTGGGTQPYQWYWSNGETTSDIFDLSGGDYVLDIIDDHNCVKTYTFFIDSSNVECISLVNSFTPNGDDYNDTWIIQNIDLYPNAEVKIFNRWGNLLYETKGAYTPWDGNYNGSPLPSEVYYFIIVLNNSVKNKYTGTVTIVR